MQIYDKIVGVPNLFRQNVVKLCKNEIMVSDKITVEDIQNLVKGVLKVTMPDYKACRSAMSMVTYTKDTWPKENNPKPLFSSTIDKETNTITITCVR